MGNYVSLSDDELVLLDGNCSKDVQEKVTEIKRARTLNVEGVSEAQKKMIFKIVQRITEDKKMTNVRTSAKCCPACGKDAGYYAYARNGKYHRKGEPDRNKPKSLSVYDFSRGFVTFTNTIFHGWCMECDPLLRPILKAELKDVVAELPAEFCGEVKYKKVDEMQCLKCDWVGPENSMGKLSTLMGDGHFFGKCPSCKTEKIIFGPTVFKKVGIVMQKENSNA